MKQFILAFTAISSMVTFDASASNNEQQGFFDWLVNGDTTVKSNTRETNSPRKKTSPRSNPNLIHTKALSTQNNLSIPSSNIGGIQPPLFSNMDVNLTTGSENNKYVSIERQKSPPPSENMGASTMEKTRNVSLKDDTSLLPNTIPSVENKTIAPNDDQLILPKKEEVIRTENTNQSPSTPILTIVANKEIVTESPKESEQKQETYNNQLVLPKKEEIVRTETNQFPSTPVITLVNKEETPPNQIISIEGEEEITSINNTNQPLIEEKKIVPSKGIFKYLSETFIESQSTPDKFIDISLKMVLQSVVKYNKTLNGAIRIEIQKSSDLCKLPITDEEKYLAFTKGQYEVELPCQSVFKLKEGVHYVMYNDLEKIYELIKITELGIPTPKGLIFEKTDSGTDIHYHVKSITITNKKGKVTDPLFDVLTSKGFSESIASGMTKAPKTFRENAVVNMVSVEAKTGLLYTLNDLNLDYKIEAKLIKNTVPKKEYEITDLLMDK